jgi:membrane protease YdiL (CAAX protease family)
MTASSSRAWTMTGLAIALLGIPAIVTAHRLLAPDPAASSAIIIRELAILAMTAFLLWIVVSKERLPLSSIGIRTDGIGRSLAWGFGLAVVAFAVLIGILLIFSAMGIRYGEGTAISRALPVTLLAVIRAGISEELLYRGFALERLQSMTGSKWIAAGVTLVLFAAFHFRQGWPGVWIAFIIGAVFTAFYLWKRNLIANMFGHFLVDFVPNVVLPLIVGEDM